MHINKLILTTVLILGLSVFSNTEEAEAAIWIPRTVAQVKSDFKKIDTNEMEYTVQWGDTLYSISRAANVDVNDLAQINKIENMHIIFPGNKLTFKADKKGVVEEVTFVDTVTDEITTYDTETQTIIEQTIIEPEIIEQPKPKEMPEMEMPEMKMEMPEPEIAAAQAQPIHSTNVPYYIYQVVEAEAGPGYTEAANVMSVIVNRANVGIWGGTSYMDVVTASGQFEVHANGMAAAIIPSPETIQAVNDVVAGNITTSAHSFHASGNGVTNVFY